MPDSEILNPDQRALKKRGFEFIQLTLNKRFKHRPDPPEDIVEGIIKRYNSDKSLLSFGFLLTAYQKKASSKIEQAFDWIVKFKQTNDSYNPLQSAIVITNWILCCLELEKKALKEYIEGSRPDIPTLMGYSLTVGNESLFAEFLSSNKSLHKEQLYFTEINRINAVYQQTFKRLTKNFLHALVKGERVGEKEINLLRPVPLVKVKFIAEICKLQNIEVKANCHTAILSTLKTLKDTTALKKILKLENLPLQIKDTVQNLIIKHEKSPAANIAHTPDRRPTAKPKSKNNGIFSFRAKILDSKIINKGKKSFSSLNGKKAATNHTLSLASSNANSKSKEPEIKINLPDYFEKAFIKALDERDKQLLIEILRSFEEKAKKGKKSDKGKILHELFNETMHLRNPLHRFFLYSTFVEKLGLEEINSVDDLEEEDEFTWGLMQVGNEDNRIFIDQELVDPEESDENKSNLYKEIKESADERFNKIFEKINPRIEAIRSFLDRYDLPKEVTANITDYMPLNTMSFIKNHRMAEKNSEKNRYETCFELIQESHNVENKIHRIFFQLALALAADIGNNQQFYDQNPRYIQEIKALTSLLNKEIESIGEGRDSYGFHQSELSTVKNAGMKRLQEIEKKTTLFFEEFEADLREKQSEFASLVELITHSYLKGNYQDLDDLNRDLETLKKKIKEFELEFLQRKTIAEYNLYFYRLFVNLIRFFSAALPIIIKHKPILYPEILHKIDDDFLDQGKRIIAMFSSSHVDFSSGHLKRHALNHIRELIKPGIWPDYVDFAKETRAEFD